MAQVSIIGETACAHEGSCENLLKMIDAIAEAKADIVHFIVFTTEGSTSPKHPGYEKGKELELSAEEWKKAIFHAKSKKMKVATTIQDEASLKLVSSLDVDIIKIHSTDNTNPELIRKAAEKNKQMMISVGAMTMEEIEKAIDTIKEAGNNDIILMYGYQDYPTDPALINLRMITTLKEKFKVAVGYADHTDGESKLANAIPLLSIPLGAEYVDKHITLDRSKKGIDYQAALNPDEFKDFVKCFRTAEKSIGDGIRHEFTDAEKRYRELVKKSIVAAKNLKKGKRITKDDVLFLRSDRLGMAPYELVNIISKTLKRDIKKYDNIERDDI
jgi:sialic acid synthase SpsE